MNRLAILALDDLPIELVEVPEWGCDLYVRTLPGSERDAFEAASTVGKGRKRETSLENFRARMVVACCCNGDRSAVFESSDVEALSKKSGKALGRICDVASRLNGWSADDVEDMAKN